MEFKKTLMKKFSGDVANFGQACYKSLSDRGFVKTDSFGWVHEKYFEKYPFLSSDKIPLERTGWDESGDKGVMRNSGWVVATDYWEYMRETRQLDKNELEWWNLMRGERLIKKANI